MKKVFYLIMLCFFSFALISCNRIIKDDKATTETETEVDTKEDTKEETKGETKEESTEVETETENTTEEETIPDIFEDIEGRVLIKDLKSQKLGSKVIVEGLVISVAEDGYMINDETGLAFIRSENASCKVNDIVLVQGITDLFEDFVLNETNSRKLKEYPEGFPFKDANYIDLIDYYGKSDKTFERVSITGNISNDGENLYYLYNVNDYELKKIILKTSQIDLKPYLGKGCKLNGVLAKQTTYGNEDYLNFYISSLEEIELKPEFYVKVRNTRYKLENTVEGQYEVKISAKENDRIEVIGLNYNFLSLKRDESEINNINVNDLVISGGDKMTFKVYFEAGNTFRYFLDGLFAGLMTIEEAINTPNDSEVCISGIITSYNGRGFILEDETGAIHVYGTLNQDALILLGNKLIVRGKKTTFNNTYELLPSTFNIISKNNELPLKTPVKLTADVLNDLVKNPNKETKLYEAKGVLELTDHGRYYTAALEVAGSSTTINFNFIDGILSYLKSFNHQVVIMRFYNISYNTGRNSVDAIFESLNPTELSFKMEITANSQTTTAAFGELDGKFVYIGTFNANTNLKIIPAIDDIVVKLKDVPNNPLTKNSDGTFTVNKNVTNGRLVLHMLDNKTYEFSLTEKVTDEDAITIFEATKFVSTSTKVVIKAKVGGVAPGNVFLYDNTGVIRAALKNPDSYHYGDIVTVSGSVVIEGELFLKNTTVIEKVNGDGKEPNYRVMSDSDIDNFARTAKPTDLRLVKITGQMTEDGFKVGGYRVDFVYVHGNLKYTFGQNLNKRLAMVGVLGIKVNGQLVFTLNDYEFVNHDDVASLPVKFGPFQGTGIQMKYEGKNTYSLVYNFKPGVAYDVKLDTSYTYFRYKPYYVEGAAYNFENKTNSAVEVLNLTKETTLKVIVQLVGNSSDYRLYLSTDIEGGTKPEPENPYTQVSLQMFKTLSNNAKAEVKGVLIGFNDEYLLMGNNTDTYLVDYSKHKDFKNNLFIGYEYTFKGTVMHPTRHNILDLDELIKGSYKPLAPFDFEEFHGNDLYRFYKDNTYVSSFGTIAYAPYIKNSDRTRFANYTMKLIFSNQADKDLIVNDNNKEIEYVGFVVNISEEVIGKQTYHFFVLKVNHLTGIVDDSGNEIELPYVKNYNTLAIREPLGINLLHGSYEITTDNTLTTSNGKLLSYSMLDNATLRIDYDYENHRYLLSLEGDEVPDIKIRFSTDAWANNDQAQIFVIVTSSVKTKAYRATLITDNGDFGDYYEVKISNYQRDYTSVSIVRASYNTSNPLTGGTIYNKIEDISRDNFVNDGKFYF